MLDPSYKSALELDPDRFACSAASPAELGILDQIAIVLAPNAAGLRAELYKLNMYTCTYVSTLVRPLQRLIRNQSWH